MDCPNEFVNYVENLYSELQGQVMAGPYRSKLDVFAFWFQMGVFKGDILSPIIFLTVFNPIVQHLKYIEDIHDYHLNGSRYITLPFADDFWLITFIWSS